MAVTRFPVVSGELPLAGGTEVQITNAGFWLLESVCCVDQLRYVTASGEMTMSAGDDTPAWVNLGSVAVWDLPDGSRSYLATVPYLICDGANWALEMLAAISVSPPGYASVTGVALAFTAFDLSNSAPFVGIADYYKIGMWWDSESPHDIQGVASVGIGSPTSATLGFTFTGAEPFLLNGNPGPLPDATYGGFNNNALGIESYSGSVQAWSSGCGAEFLGTFTEVPFEQVTPPCYDEFFQDGFEGDAGQVGSPPYLNPSVVAM